MNGQKELAAVEAVLARLDEGDDPAFWTTLLDAVFTEIDGLWATVRGEGVRAVAIQVCRLSRWRRPHQTRWIKGGGFAWPVSYSLHNEEHADWRVWISRERGQDWTVSPSPPRRKRGHYQAVLAAPSGTAKHEQGAAMVSWRPEFPFAKMVYRQQPTGLRKIEGRWQVVAGVGYKRDGVE